MDPETMAPITMREEATPDSKPAIRLRVWAWATAVITGMLMPVALTSWPFAAGMLALGTLALAVYLLAEAPLRHWRPETDNVPGWKLRPLLPRMNGLIAAALMLVAAPVILPWVGPFEWLRNVVLTAVIAVILMRPCNEMNAALALTGAALAGVTMSGLLPVAVIYLGYVAVALGLITSGAFYLFRGYPLPGWLRPLSFPLVQGLIAVTGLGLVFGGLGAPQSVDAGTLQTLRGSFPLFALLVLIRTALAWSGISRASLGRPLERPPEGASAPITTQAAARVWSLNRQRQRLKQTIKQIENSPASKLVPSESGHLSERARAALAEVGRREDEARLRQAHEEMETLGRAIQDEYHLLGLPSEAQTVTRWPTSVPPEPHPLVTAPLETVPDPRGQPVDAEQHLRADPGDPPSRDT
ncbi:hypothetical protein [Deinococcus sp. AJ005]|uniref:hypothetical protein n=1 Tax=Deinococcus sp. AJ005 TaxID=2652443 RepID=UPI00125CC094|nr:hypothetical protein [Deinococcus sp. AJ005]QFP75713.1 hypothetical protein DAAJ005_03995 [Deinococcus sp. AJ005]